MSIDHKTQDLLDEKKANWEGDVTKTWMNEKTNKDHFIR